MSDDNIIDLASVETQTRPPDVRIIVELWKRTDGMIEYGFTVEEWVPEGAKLRDRSWLRANLRQAVLVFARRWRLGLVRRKRRS